MDAIGLNQKQIKAFTDWRVEVAPKMILLMKTIAIERLKFQQKSLNPSITAKQLIDYQSQIFKLHKKLLMMKLKCRKVLTSSFTEEQWENLFFILSEELSLDINRI